MHGCSSRLPAPEWGFGGMAWIGAQEEQISKSESLIRNPR